MTLTTYKIVVRTEDTSLFKYHEFKQVTSDIFEIKLTPEQYANFLSLYDLQEGKIYNLKNAICGELYNVDSEYVAAFYIPLKRKRLTVNDLIK